MWCTNRFSIEEFYIIPLSIYVFFIYLRTNSDFCPMQHKLIGFISEMKSVCYAVRTGSLNKTVWASYLLFRGLKHAYIIAQLSGS